MKHIYVADDGKKFDTEEDCIVYENKVKVAELQRKKKAEEKEQRYKEVMDAYQAYRDLANKYLDDYPSETSKRWDSLLRWLV